LSRHRAYASYDRCGIPYLISHSLGGTLFRMPQEVRERLSERILLAVCQGRKPGDVRIKLGRRSRGKIETASLRVSLIMSRLISH